MSYTGGKNNSGSYQQIISTMPAHDVYIEPFLGSGAVFRNKRKAAESYLLDKDLTMLQGYAGSNVRVVCMDALDFLGQFDYGRRRVLIYLDPPYLFSTRLSGEKKLYKHEFGSVEEHKRLLQLVIDLPAMVAISGYASELYSSMLPGWELHSWNVRTRQGIATEFLWTNYDTPIILHDGRYVGGNYISRQRLRRLMGVESR